MTWRLCILSTIPGQWLAQRRGHPCLEDEWANIMSRVRAIQDQSWPCMGLNHSLITGLPGSQVGDRIPLTSSSSIVSVPVQNTGKVMESSKEPGHFGQFTWQNVLRTVTTDQHWGISLSDSRVRMRARTLEEPYLPSGESLQKCHLLHHLTIRQGLQGSFQGQEPTRGTQISVPSLRAHTGFAARQTCFLTALMYQCIA